MKKIYKLKAFEVFTGFGFFLSWRVAAQMGRSRRLCVASSRHQLLQFYHGTRQDGHLFGLPGEMEGDF